MNFDNKLFVGALINLSSLSVLFQLLGCATYVSDTTYKNVEPKHIAKNFDKCVIRITYIRKFRETIQLRKPPKNLETKTGGGQGRFAATQMGLCRLVEDEKVFERNVTAEFSIAGLKKNLELDALAYPSADKLYLDFFVLDKGYPKLALLHGLNMYYHIYTIGLLPFWAPLENSQWMIVKYPQKRELEAYTFENSSSLIAWTPLFLFPGMKPLGIAEDETRRNLIRENMMMGFNLIQ